MMPTIQTALQSAINQLVHLPNPYLEARIILCHLLRVSRSYLYAWNEKILTIDEHIQFQTLINRRLQGEPIAYLIGKKEFWSLELEVTPHTLIPRPETELLVELALHYLPLQQRTTIFDLGTGSGAIALALASERPHCHVLATDNDSETLAVAQRNAARLGISNIQFGLSNWFSALAEIKAELIVSNPPYIASDDPHLKNLDYEPVHALIGGTDGLLHLRYLIATSPHYIKPNGWLLVEHGCNQAGKVRQLFIHANYAEVTTHNDLAGLPRVTQGQVIDSR